MKDLTEIQDSLIMKDSFFTVGRPNVTTLTQAKILFVLSS